MPNIDLYRGGRRGLLGGQVDRIPSYTAKPYDIITPASARYTFAADMVRALTAKAEKDKEDKIRSGMLAAMIGDEYQHDPSKASESFERSPYVESQRVALADAQAQAQPEGVSALGLGPGDTPFASGPYVPGGELEQPGQLGFDSTPFNIEKMEAQNAQSEIDRGIRAFPVGLGPADPADDAAMRAALIGKIETPLGYAGDRGGRPASTEAEELTAYTGSAEDRAAQERAHKATVNTIAEEKRRMAEVVSQDPNIVNSDEYAQWVQSIVTRQQALVTRDEKRAYEADLLDAKRQEARDVAALLQTGREDIERLKPSSSITPTKPVTFDMRDPEETRLELGLAEGSEGTYRYKQDPTSGAYTLERIGSAVEDVDKGSQSKLLSLYKEQTGLEEMLVDMDREKVPGNNPERMRVANRLKVLKDIIAKDAQVLATGAYYKEGGKQKEGRDSLDYKQAQQAVVDLERDEKLIRLLHKGKATTGFAADWIQNINRLVNFVKDDPRLAEGVSDTQLVDVLMGAQVFPLIKALGIGARGMDTPQEREFMRRVLTGTLTLDKETLLEMARMRQKQSLGAIKNWDTRLNRGEVDDYLAVNRISIENARIQNPYSNQNRIAAINEMDLNQVNQYMHIGLPEKVKEAILARIRALK